MGYPATPKLSKLDHFSTEITMVTWGSPIGRTPLYPTMTFLIFFRWMVQPPDAGCLPHLRKLPGPSARDVYRNLIWSESEHWGGSRERNKKKSMCSYHQIWIHMELPAIFPVKFRDFYFSFWKWVYSPSEI